MIDIPVFLSDCFLKLNQLWPPLFLQFVANIGCQMVFSIDQLLMNVTISIMI